MKRQKDCTSSLFQITGKELCETLDKVPEIGEAVFKMKQEVESSINCIKPENAISIMGKNVVYYHSASINGKLLSVHFFLLEVKNITRGSGRALLPRVPYQELQHRIL